MASGAAADQAVALELSVRELLTSLAETLTAGGDKKHTELALELELLRFANGMRIQGYTDSFLASVFASTAMTYMAALLESAYIACPDDDVARYHHIIASLQEGR